MIGGGDSAAEQAVLLSRLAASVTLVHRRAAFRAGAALMARVRNATRIRVLAPAEVARWVVDEASGALVAAELRGAAVGEAARVAASGAFVAVGHEPASQILPKQVELDAQGYVVLRSRTMTSADGIFACGDAADPRRRHDPLAATTLRRRRLAATTPTATTPRRGRDRSAASTRPLRGVDTDHSAASTRRLRGVDATGPRRRNATRYKKVKYCLVLPPRQSKQRHRRQGDGDGLRPRAHDEAAAP